MKILQWIIALLVLCNIGLILTIWLKPGMPHAPQHGESPRDMVVRSLGFSDDQVKKYDMLIQQHQTDMRRLRQQGMEYREQLFGNLKNEQAGNTKADSIAGLIANNQRAIEMATYNHFAKVRELCTGQQKQEFDKIIGAITKKMGGPGGGHRPPPPPGNEPPGGPPPGEAGTPPPDAANH